MFYSTMTTCDENVPEVALFDTPDQLEAALFTHYTGVWAECEGAGEMPASADEIKSELLAQGRLSSRHIAHVAHHTLLSFTS